ncbi:MAG: patatin [Pseudomonadota bacterium]
MSLEKLLNRVLIMISILTVLSGLTQMFFPGLVLRIMSAELTPTTTHFFATVGMFMVGFGGVFLQSLLSGKPDPVVAFWASMQKFGAAVMVGLGVMHGLFSWLALGVAGFDLLSGLLAILYWRKISAAQS